MWPASLSLLGQCLREREKGLSVGMPRDRDINVEAVVHGRKFGYLTPTNQDMQTEGTIDDGDEAGYLTAQTVWMFPLPPGTTAYMEWYQGAQLLREERLEKTSTMPRPQPLWLV